MRLPKLADAPNDSTLGGKHIIKQVAGFLEIQDMLELKAVSKVARAAVVAELEKHLTSHDLWLIQDTRQDMVDMYIDLNDAFEWFRYMVGSDCSRRLGLYYMRKCIKDYQAFIDTLNRCISKYRRVRDSNALRLIMFMIYNAPPTFLNVPHTMVLHLCMIGLTELAKYTTMHPEFGAEALKRLLTALDAANEGFKSKAGIKEVAETAMMRAAQ